MDLGVWVEGSRRVVCGLSLHTSVQDVVIALAQDLGQTGRYVLTLQLHGSERQLLKDERPLQELSMLGHNSRDAQFILRRTRPSTSALHSQKPSSPRALRTLEQELQQRHLQGERISVALEKTQQQMHKSDRRMKVRLKPTDHQGNEDGCYQIKALIHITVHDI
uniref:Ras-associating domain-containing protein n=1 Tax=Neogobius melanostomus TaxID=47308 RepID=A0A8C6WSE9_9GOBI